MLNDLSSPLALLATRRSGRPSEMVGPGPTTGELRTILSVAARTPDHGKLTPWRFVVVERDQRPALARLLHHALETNDPDALTGHHVKADAFAHQGEALVVVLSAPAPNHKIPAWEQELSVGAAAMNLLHAASGWAAYDPVVTSAFCLGNERIAGFFFIGSPGVPLIERPRPDLSSVVRAWTPPED
jgi:nitroreductase